MAALPNIGGALCSTPQSLADAHYRVPCSNSYQDAKPVEICWDAPNSPTDLSRQWAEVHHIVRTCGGRHRCLKSFFPIVYACLSCEYIARHSCAMVPRWRFLGVFASCISASREQHVSDLHLKFALRPHQVWKYGRHPICDGWY